MRRNPRGLLALVLLLGLQMTAPLLWAQNAAQLAVRDKAAPAAQPFALEDVRLLDGPFRQAQLRDAQYLLQLDADRLLHMFRVNAGLPSTAKPLGGWEAPQVELRGHTLGHYLSACALMYAGTGDERFKARSDRIVAERIAEHHEPRAYAGAERHMRFAGNGQRLRPKHLAVRLPGKRHKGGNFSAERFLIHGSHVHLKPDTHLYSLPYPKVNPAVRHNPLLRLFQCPVMLDFGNGNTRRDTRQLRSSDEEVIDC